LMIQKGKQVFVYFSDKPVRKSEIDMEAETKIQAFKEKYKDRGIYVVYASDEEFNDYVSMHLTRYLTTELANEVNRVNEHTRFDDSISQRKEVDLIYDYTKFYDIKQVSSYTDSNIMKIRTHKDSFEMDIDIINVNKIENKEFAMALFEYAPCDNWSAFFEAGYFFEFDAASSGDIRAFQLEIKDDIRNKVIDRTLQVSCEEEHFRIWIPSTTRDSTAWKKISQVCFVVFFNSTYIDGEKGLLTIRNLKMVPR